MNKAVAVFKLVVIIAVSLYAQTEEELLETGIPVISINTENGAAITSKEVYTNIEWFKLTDPNNSCYDFERKRADIARPNRPADEIRGRGNATWGMYGLNYPKKPYRIRFNEQLEILGLPKARNWVLLAEYRDPTFLFNSLAFKLAGDIFEKPFTHNYIHVHLILNGNYRGLYGLTEHKQVHENRIDIDPDDGWYVDIDHYYDEEPKFTTTNYSLPIMIKSPEPSGVATMLNPAYSFVRDDWNEMCGLMAASSFPENGYRELIDMYELVDFLLVNEIAKNEELGHNNQVHSLLAYKDKGGKITFGPVWDFDCGYGYDYATTHVYFISSSFAGFIAKHNFLQRFYSDPTFNAILKARWKEKYAEIMGVTAYIDSVKEAISNAVAKDTERWYSPYNTDFNIGYVASQYEVDYENVVSKLKTWLANRISWLNTAINNIEAPTLPNSGKPLGSQRKAPSCRVTPSSSSSSETPSSSSSENGTPILNSLAPTLNSNQAQYYNLKGIPLGTQKPTASGVYIEKTGKNIRKIVVQ